MPLKCLPLVALPLQLNKVNKTSLVFKSHPNRGVISTLNAPPAGFTVPILGQGNLKGI